MRLQGRGITGGRMDGLALVSHTPLSFLGGLDPDSGTVRDPQSDIVGASLAGRIFVFPQGKGSTVGSYVLYAACRRGVGPTAILCGRAETIVAAGAVIADLPLVDGVDIFAVETGDRIAVDGGSGGVELPDVREEAVASAFLRRGDRFLFLHRGPTAPTHPGLWHGVSGRVEGHEDPADCALREIQEETGLAATEAARGDPLYVRHRGHAFRIHPFLFDCPSGEPRLNFENTEALWLTLAEVTPLPTVPRLRDAVLAALHAVPRSPGA